MTLEIAQGMEHLSVLTVCATAKGLMPLAGGDDVTEVRIFLLDGNHMSTEEVKVVPVR